MSESVSVPPAIVWQDGRLTLLDQRCLPGTISYLDIDTIEAALDAIRSLAVRGAPAIGIAAAYALAVSLRCVPGNTFAITLADHARKLVAARPTAVNLAWAVERLCAVAAHTPTWNALLQEAKAIHAEDRAICQAIGAAGLPLIKPGSRVLTHCNAGSLAVSELGTATAPLYLAHQAGTRFQVFADETRPLLQGARLTAWELDQAGIDVTLLCDNAAASLLASGGIDLVLVGTDRVTANGDVINKIGTLNLAVLCNHYNIPFYVACPSSTFDGATPSGSMVEIEQRAADEILSPTTAQVKVYNPAFDVTPARLVTALVTDRGMIESPSQVLLSERFNGSRML